jgi:hypothetical protein
MAEIAKRLLAAIWHYNQINAMWIICLLHT